MFFVGDIAITGLLVSDYKKNTSRFKEIISLNNNFGICNLECPIFVADSQNEYKNFIHTSEKKVSQQILNLLNIKCVSLANNHIYDCKMPGLIATIDMLKEVNVQHTGAGWKKEHIDPVIIDYNDKKIGFLAYVDKSTNPKTENFPELFINYIDENEIIKKLNELKSKVSKIILSLHWGVDYSFYPTKEQRRMAKLFVEAGADIIMGHHPHTIQPYEKYNNSYILYSLGGLTFGDYKRNPESELQALFRKTKRGVIVNYDNKNNMASFISTKELKGNYIKLIKFNYFKWSQKMWIYFKIKHFHSIFTNFFLFKEKIIDRVYEYFFGYYKNPIKRFFQFSNIKKIPKLFK